MEKTKVKFEGIDSWNRPIFKDIESKKRFGSVDVLCTSKEEVLAKVTEDDLCYFGNSFDCEPMGDPVNNLQIIRE